MAMAGIEIIYHVLWQRNTSPLQQIRGLLWIRIRAGSDGDLLEPARLQQHWIHTDAG